MGEGLKRAAKAAKATTQESAKCANCGGEFVRRIKLNPRTLCDRIKCRKLRKLLSANEKPVSMQNIPTKNPTEYRADLDYHGKPYI